MYITFQKFEDRKIFNLILFLMNTYFKQECIKRIKSDSKDK